MCWLSEEKEKDEGLAVVKMLALDIKVNDCKFKQNVNK